MKTLRPGDFDNMNPEGAGCFWRDSETYCDKIIDQDPIPEVPGLRVIKDELESRRDHENVNLSLGWHFFDDDGK